MSELRKNEEIFSLIEKNKSKQVVLYGAASRGVRALYNLIDKGFPRERIIFCDSNPRLWNTELYGFPIISLQELEKLPKDTCVIVSSSVRYEIIPSLEKLGFTEIHYCYSLNKCMKNMIQNFLKSFKK